MMSFMQDGRANDGDYAFNTDGAGLEILEGEPNILMSRMNRIGSSLITRARVNGGVVGTTSFSGGSFDDFAATATMVGSHGGTSFYTRYLDGAIGEVLIYHDLSDYQRQLIEGYLAHKWGLTGKLSIMHPWKTITPPWNPTIGL
jgi:hypothetical protein